MERGESAIFYSDDEEEKEEEKETKAEDTELEKYSTVAVRAKLSVEVEQRKRLGAWGKRVLVLDGATLYAYKTKGDGGSVGGWAIGGADVHVRQNNDSNRDDGRHILVISRPPVYKLVFAFSTTYEQARMIQALSSSGATVTGLDAIMLMKNLRQQQEQEQQEEEAREKKKESQKTMEESMKANGTVPSLDTPQVILDSDESRQRKDEVPSRAIEDKENLKQNEDVDESIYDQSTGTVANPLYTSTINLSQKEDSQMDESERSSISSSVSSSSSSLTVDVSQKPSDTSQVSSTTVASDFQAPSASQDSEDKVNPVPKPPRASVSEGSHVNSSDLQGDSEGKNNTVEDDAGNQSVLNIGSVLEGLSGDADKHKSSSDGNEGGQKPHITREERFLSKEETSEHTDSLHSTSEEDSEEGEGFYQVNPDPENSTANSEVWHDHQDNEVAAWEGNPDSNYLELVRKMKLERGVSIESQNGGALQDIGSPEGARKILGDSPFNDEVVKSPSPSNEIPINIDLLGETSDKEVNEDGLNNETLNKVVLKRIVSEEFLSDNDEKFEQLYRELSSDVPGDVNSEGRGNDSAENLPNGETKQINYSHDTSSSITESSMTNSDVTLEENGESVEGGITDIKTEAEDVEDGIHSQQSQDTSSLIRINSIIKKNGSQSSGKSKKVQFNLEASTTIESGSSLPATDQNEDNTSTKYFSLKKRKNESALSANENLNDTTPESLTKPKSSGSTQSPTKKRGIFASIFTGSTSKKSSDLATAKEDASSKKNSSISKSEPSSVVKKGADLTTTKEDTTGKTNKEPAKFVEHNKKPVVSSQSSIKKQPTVDLTAPLIIGGSVEMGGSISGKVSSRSIEVRDGHVLAFMPKATSPSSRLSLVGLSVTPLIGGIHPNALSLTRNSRCMMVIKLSARGEMMRWINILSDEVLKVTPEDQRKGLVLYPSPKKEEPENKVQNGTDDVVSQQAVENGSTEAKHNTILSNKQLVEMKGAEKKALPNGHHVDNTDPEGVNSEGEGIPKGNNIPKPLSNGTDKVGGEEDTGGEDTGDGWRKKKPPVTEEFEMKTLPRPGVAKSNDTKANDLTLIEQHFKEEKKEAGHTIRKINKLNIEERWKEHITRKEGSQKGNLNVRRSSTDDRNRHQPLRRISMDENTSLHSRIQGEEAAGNLLFINSSPKRDYHANCHPPLERLSNQSRVLSASESNLRKTGDQRSQSNIQRLHKFGSAVVLQEKTKKEFNNNAYKATRDNSNILVSSRIIQNHRNSVKSNNQQGKMNGYSPTSNPSHARSRQSVTFEPRDVEIVETKEPMNKEPVKNYSAKANDTPQVDQWYDDGEPEREISEPPQSKSKELPGITWSVAATREKFELLCSFSGENKTGKLTTKTPISRKRSMRGSFKKRRSLEGSSVRRANVRKSVMRSILANDSTEAKLNSTEEPSQIHQKTSNCLQAIRNSSISNPLQEKNTKTIQSTFKLQPVSDRRKNFEQDSTDTTDSDLYKSTSSDSLTSEVLPVRPENNATQTHEEPISPIKSPLRRTQNVLYPSGSPASSPEPGLITSKLINGRPKGNIPEEDKGIVSRSLITETKMNKDAYTEVVICYRGPYIAQEAEQAVLSNISNAFLAKRRLLAKEISVARIQEKLSTIEERLWEVQAAMGELDNQRSAVNAKTTSKWRELEKALRTAEEETAHWTSRLTQTQKEAEEAREKLAAALASGLAQYDDNSNVSHLQKHKLMKRYMMEDNDNDEDEVEDKDEVDVHNNDDDSFA